MGGLNAAKLHGQRLRAPGGLVTAVGVAALLLLATRLSWGDLALPQRRGGAKSSAAVQRIPKILHHAYLSGREAFLSLASDPASAMRPEWAQWCEALHDGWEYRFWTEAAAVQLLEEHYPWFLPTWRSYKHIVEKGDAIRYFIMHRYGGVYYDLDVECFRKGEDMLVGADVVLQGTSGQEGVTNAMMASVPGHPLWERIFKLLQERQGKWVIEATGPSVVRDAALDIKAVPNSFVGLHKWQNTFVRVWPLGEWTTPCWASDRKCHQNMALQRAAGIFKPKLVAYHRYTGSWLNMDNAAHFLTHGGLEGRLFGAAEVQDAVAETIDDRPASIVRGKLEDGVLRIACPRPGWRITSVHSAFYGARPAAGGEAKQQRQQQQQQQEEEEEQQEADAAEEEAEEEAAQDSGGPQLPGKQCKSGSAFAAVAAACVGRWRCFLQQNARALGPDPCADQGAVDLTLEATVVCSPPRMVKDDAQQPLAPALQERLKWRKSHQLEVPALAALLKRLTLSCPASDWRMTKVAPLNCTASDEPSPMAAAVHELCLGRAECSVAFSGGGAHETLQSLKAQLRVSGSDAQSQDDGGGAVAVTCVPRGSATPLPTCQNAGGSAVDNPVARDNSLSAIFRALGLSSGPTVTLVCKRWRQVFFTEPDFFRDVALELPWVCSRVVSYAPPRRHTDEWFAGKEALLHGCASVASSVSVRGIDVLDAAGAASSGCWSAADLLHALQPAVLRRVSLQASQQVPGSALQALRRFTKLEALQLDCYQLPRNTPVVLRCLRHQLTSLCLRVQQPTAGCVDGLLQLGRLCSLELAWWGDQHPAPDLLLRLTCLGGLTSLVLQDRSDAASALGGSMFFPPLGDFPCLRSADLSAASHFQIMGATLHSAVFSLAGSNGSLAAALSIEGAVLYASKSPSLLQLVRALLPGAAGGGALSLRLHDCTLPLHSLLSGTAPAPVCSLLLEHCRFPGNGPAVALNVLLSQLPALSAVSLIGDPEGEGAALLDWVPGELIWRSGLTHLALVGQRVTALPPGPYLSGLLELDLSDCTFARLPRELSAASCLTCLKLGGNLDLKLSAADVEAGLLPLAPRLRQLHLWGCDARQSALAALFSAAPALNADSRALEAAWPPDWYDDEDSVVVSGEHIASERSSGERGSGECGSGECSSGERLTGEASSGEASSGEERSESSSSSAPSSAPSGPSSIPSSPTAHSGGPSSVPSSPAAHSRDPSSASGPSAPSSPPSDWCDDEYGMGGSSDGGGGSSDSTGSSSAGSGSDGMGSGSSDGSDGMPSAGSGTGSGHGEGMNSNGGTRGDDGNSGAMQSSGGGRKVNRKLSF